MRQRFNQNSLEKLFFCNYNSIVINSYLGVIKVIEKYKY